MLSFSRQAEQKLTTAIDAFSFHNKLLPYGRNSFRAS